jgi:hypothetical protein
MRWASIWLVDVVNTITPLNLYVFWWNFTYGLSNLGWTFTAKNYTPTGYVGPLGQFSCFKLQLPGATGMSITEMVAIAGTSVALGVGAVVAAPFVIGAKVFVVGGIAAGSLAAGMMSSSAIASGGGVVAGGVVATLQSAGVVGLAAGTQVALGGAVATVTGGAAVAIDKVAGFFKGWGQKKEDNEEEPEEEKEEKKY